jgi:hypothetical protein
MANYKSTACSNREASALTLHNPSIAISDAQYIGGHVAVLADIAVADTIEFFRLPSSARLLDLEICNDDLGTDLTIDIGLGYPNDGAAPTAVDADCLVDAYQAGTAAAVWTSVLGTGTNGPPPEEMLDNNRLWELAGLSADPDREMVVYATVTVEDTGAAGDITLRGKWASEMGGA